LPPQLSAAILPPLAGRESPQKVPPSFCTAPGVFMRRAADEPDDPAARAVLAHVRSLGHFVSYHRLPSSLLGTVPACIETHAVGPDGQQHVAKVVGGESDEDYRCACVLAEMVGVDLEG
jgi:hypothetical protein